VIWLVGCGTGWGLQAEISSRIRGINKLNLFFIK